MNFLESKIDNFLRYKKRVEGFSKASLKTYRLNLQEAIKYIDVEEKGGSYYLQLMPYRAKISNNKKKTIAKKISIVRSFVEFLRDNGESIKLYGDESIKVPKTLPKPVNFRYIKEALDIASEEEKMILLLMYGLGLRISEVSNLKVEDIKGEWIEVSGKGDKRRNIPILPNIKEKLDSFLLNNKPKEYIFEKDGKRVDENGLRYRVDKLFKKIGIKVTPHQLRHSYASDILNSGGRISDVSKLLGHSSMATTEIYTKLDSEYKMRNYKLAHPLFNKRR